ncbi:MAG: sodium-independent anion transporter, partial [Elusimicrobia bacterium]|nr:sodium-independent anion transporter [Elusimicrobiota bacterium]
MLHSSPPSSAVPKLWTCLQDYSWERLTADLTAGVIVGLVALPLAIAFAISSGVTPDKGFTTAIIAGFLISALGGSRVQIGGPTGAFVVIVYGIVQGYGIEGLTLCTIMAGVMLVLMGVFGLGELIRIIPYPVTVGFTTGIAVTIFSQQIRDLFGLQLASIPADFVDKWAAYARAAATADPATVGLSAACLGVLAFWPKVSRRVPGPIIVLLGGTAAAVALGLSVETIGSRFGELPHGLSRPVWPEITLEKLRLLARPAATVALLGAIESLLSATVADTMIDGRHRPNTELIAQGVANIVTPLFGGIPATGAIARTATNVKNGARTPVAGIVHALTLLVVMLAFGRWAAHIPLCALASILVFVAYHMSEWHSFLALLRAPRTDVAILLATFLLTVFVDLTVAVEAGMLMSVFLFMKRMTDVTTIRQIKRGTHAPEESLKSAAGALSHSEVPEGVALYEAEGAFFFGVAQSLRDNLW